MKISPLFILTMVLVRTIPAQTEFVAPVPPVKGPAYDVSIGYDYLSMRMPPAGRASFAGVTGSGLVQFNSRLAGTIELGYAHDSDVLGTGQNGHFLSLLGGPVFYLRNYKKFRMFAHGMLGAGLVDGAVPTDSGFLHGWVSRPCYAVGGGVEKLLKGPFSIRVHGDYLHTAFANSSGAIEPQNNFRLVVNFVVQLTGHGLESAR